MYEHEKEIAHTFFVAHFRWNNADNVILTIRGRDDRPCLMDGCEQPATATIHDYEDDVSGGVPLCEEHGSMIVHEESGAMPEWVSQDPEEAWTGVGGAAGNGWHGLWFLFAPVHRYASPNSEQPGEWPVEEAS
jgi:hypothetical protein